MESFAKNNILTIAVGLTAAYLTFEIATRLFEAEKIAPKKEDKCALSNLEWAFKIASNYQQECLFIDLDQYPHLKELVG